MEELVKVSMIMPVYNGADFLDASISSILSQTYENFELIMLDDASVDISWEICRRYDRKDHRIRLLRNKTNQGLVYTLNTLLDAANGELIARQDDDDLSAPDRLEKMVSFMDTNADIGLLGTAFHQIDMDGNLLTTTYQPETDTEIRWKILFANPFAHTSVMVRRKLFLKHQLHYSNDLPNSEDYELWIRMLRYTRAANLPEPLVSWRRNVRGISQTHVKEQSRNWKIFASKQINSLIPNLVREEEAESYLCIYTHRPPRKEELPRLCNLPRLLHAFSIQPAVSQDTNGLRIVRRTMVNGSMESLFNGLSKYRYYGNAAVYFLLARLFRLEPTGVINFIMRKINNFLMRLAGRA